MNDSAPEDRGDTQRLDDETDRLIRELVDVETARAQRRRPALPVQPLPTRRRSRLRHVVPLVGAAAAGILAVTTVAATSQWLPASDSTSQATSATQTTSPDTSSTYSASTEQSLARGALSVPVWRDTRGLGFPDIALPFERLRVTSSGCPYVQGDDKSSFLGTDRHILVFDADTDVTLMRNSDGRWLLREVGRTYEVDKGVEVDALPVQVGDANDRIRLPQSCVADAKTIGKYAYVRLSVSTATKSTSPTSPG